MLYTYWLVISFLRSVETSTVVCVDVYVDVTVEGKIQIVSNPKRNQDGLLIVLIIISIQISQSIHMELVDIKMNLFIS